MFEAVHHALLVLAVVALGAAGHRVAALLTDRPLERAIAAFVLATATAVVEALVLGLVAAGSDTVLLTLAAVLTFGVSAAVTAPPRPTARALVRERWEALRPGQRAAAGGLAGVALLLAVWPLRYPLIGFDGAVYHLPEIAAWVSSGRPGAIDQVSYLFPFANYPITNEVALTWAMGISRSLVPLVVWSSILLVVTAAAGAAGLAALGVGRPVRALAVAALLTTPVLLTQLGTPSTDVAALCWLVCAGALAAASRARPGLALPAIVAAGLAAGTKTTTLPLVLLVLVLMARRLRRERPSTPALAAATVLALALGGTWYIRNAVTHGSPLWPFSSLGVGDPVPRVWSLIDTSLLGRLHDTVSPRASGYADLFAGALVLFAGGGLAWVVRRSRAVVIASAASIGSLLLWAAAPSTGQPHTPIYDVNVLSTTRYALPAVAAAATALALASLSNAPLARVAVGLLAAAVGWNLVRDVQLGHLFVPYLWAFAVAAVAGALAGGVASPAASMRGALLYGAAILGCVAVAAAMSVAARGLTRRQADVAPGTPGTALVTWGQAQPGFGTAHPIHFAGTVVGQIAGDRLQHRLVLLPPTAPCGLVRARARRGLLVVANEVVFRQLGVRTPARCVAGLTPSFQLPGVRAFGRLRP